MNLRNCLRPAAARPVTLRGEALNRRFAFLRYRQVAVMLVVYALFYVCRLAFSATKRMMIDQGVYTAREIGFVGSAMLIAYAVGKTLNGFIADRANVRRYIAFGLFVTAFANFLVGWHLSALALGVVWFVNGFAQSAGAPCCVVGLSRWFVKRERGTYYGIWSCSNNLGEAFAYVLTAGVMVWAGQYFGADIAWRSGFWGAAAMGLVGLVLIKFLFLDSPESVGLPSVADWKGERTEAAERKVAGDVNAGQRLALRDWGVWMIALAGGFFAMSRYAIIDWGIFFLEVKKGYATETAAWIITLNSIVGAVSSALSGIVSDRFFKGSRNELALIAGLMNILGLSLLMLVPGQHLWVDVTAMVFFGLAVGILLTFLGGLMAVDLVPRIAAGAALGIAGLGNYFGAGVQSAISGFLVTRDAATGKAALVSHTFANGYTLDALAVFWIGMAILSVLCALSVWRRRPNESVEPREQANPKETMRRASCKTSPIFQLWPTIWDWQGKIRVFRGLSCKPLKRGHADQGRFGGFPPSLRRCACPFPGDLVTSAFRSSRFAPPQSQSARTSGAEGPSRCRALGRTSRREPRAGG